MEKQKENLEFRKTLLLKDLPETRINILAENKEIIKKSLNKILNRNFLKILTKEKIHKKEIINIAQKIKKAGYRNVNQIMLDDYYFDLKSLEFKKIISSNILIADKTINITIESSDDQKQGDMKDFINFI